MGLLHGASFVLKVGVEFLPEGEPVVVALVSHNSQAIRAALPRSMDGVRVRVRNVRASRKAP